MVGLRNGSRQIMEDIAMSPSCQRLPQASPEPSRGHRRGGYASPKNFNGDAIIGDGPGRVLTADSHGELIANLCLAAHPDTADLVEQQRFAWHDRNDVPHDHFFDVIVTERTGRRVAYAVRPAARISIEYEDRLGLIRMQAIAAGFVSDVRFITESSFDAVTKHNAALLHGSRQPDAVADGAAETIVREMSGAITIRTLSERIGLGGSGFRAVVRLLRSRHLQTLHHERIARSSLVIKIKEV